MSALLPPRYHFKIRKYHPLDRIAWALIRAYLNRGRYSARLVNTGPRPRGAVSTPAANCDGWRVYLEPKRSLLELEAQRDAGRRVIWEKRHGQRGAARRVTHIGAE